MSAHPDPPEQRDLHRILTVFEGSAPDDVSHARRLWSALSLLPPLESRLVSADIRQRLPVCRPQRGRASAPVPQSVSAPVRQRQEERRRYEAMAEQRREILALLRRQREQRVHQRALLSQALRPRLKLHGDKAQKVPDCDEMDKQLVLQLQ
ncbi:hypothetical protein JOB18_021739 [Solea senegalensis]|uniref:Cilia- and flagella-associated protein HOATZ n=1 Tax=Solea senegalensis TaxID=28829 RepID=A0AAV6RM15_SOLSE|nr:cilia- and flagella-associated protein HOATZ [Solea senegalensis]KAG7505037.1 hypothetical protein JOB18_021739 [Solea senegalensis]